MKSEETQLHGETHSVHGFKELSMETTYIHTKWVYTLNPVPVKITAGFLIRDKPILKFIWKCKDTRIVKTILKTWFWNYYGATAVNRGRYRWRDRYVDQRNRIERAEINPQKYGQLIFFFWQRFKSLIEGKSSINCDRITGYPYAKQWTSTYTLYLV